MKRILILLALSGPAFAQTNVDQLPPDAVERETMPIEQDPSLDMDRDPSSVSPEKLAIKREMNENELRVRSELPDAALKRDTRSLQNEVYKTMFKRELKTDQREDILDE